MDWERLAEALKQHNAKRALEEMTTNALPPLTWNDALPETKEVHAFLIKVRMAFQLGVCFQTAQKT